MGPGAAQAAGVAREHEMQSVIIVIHLMIVMAMIAVILLQKSEGGGLGMGGGGAGGFLSSRGTSNVLTRTTAFLAMGFFGLSLLLSILAGVERKSKSLIVPSGAPPAAGQQQQTQPELKPLDLNSLGGNQPSTPAPSTTPAPPSTPAAPATPPPPPPEGGAPQVPRSQ
jgi:preprotein translocase subunit SecG